MKRILISMLLLAAAAVRAEAPRDLLATLEAQASREANAPVAASAARGALFFRAPHAEWSCTSCHTTDPRRPGRHAVTGRSIAPMAPATNAERFTDRARMEKWFRRNCQDVLRRRCSAGEQADVLAYLMSL